MRNRPKIIPAICCIALLSACASNQKAVVSPWTIAPMVGKSSSDNSTALYQIGRYYQGQNRLNQAIAAYQKALAADKGFVEAGNALGVVYSRQGKHHDAIKAFEAAIQQAPKASHIYSNMGYAYYMQGRYAESVAALKQATALDPTNRRALNNLGLVYAKAGIEDESKQASTQTFNVKAESVIDVAVTNTMMTAEAKVVSVPFNSVHNVTPMLSEDVLLTLPKNQGAIQSVSDGYKLEVINSRVELVQVSQNVSELKMHQHDIVSPMQTSSINAVSHELDKVRVEVANGNGMTGMAAKVGNFLQSQGYPAARLTNQKPFQVSFTQIQYRDGYQTDAKLLQDSLPNSPKLILRNDLRADIGVRLVLGKDISAQVAYFDVKRSRYQLARRLDVPNS